MEITPSEIKDTYKEQMNTSWLDNIFDFFGMGAFRLTNLNYNELNWNELAEIVALDTSDTFEYVYNENEKYTCCDYSFGLMGAFHRYKSTAAMPVFLTWIQMGTAGHSVVSFYDKERVYIIEPQNDEIMTIDEATDTYGEMTLKLLCG